MARGETRDAEGASDFVHRQRDPKTRGVADCQKNPVAMPAEAHTFPGHAKTGVGTGSGVSCLGGEPLPEHICRKGWNENERPNQLVHGTWGLSAT
jgi:hypothetical protein